jgi:glucose-1-phosphate adenylyltransferase
MICDGCVISGADIQGSILGIRTTLSPFVRIENSLIMGADYYQTTEEQAEDDRQGIPRIGIGEGSLIRKALIDKNARIGRQVQIINQNHSTEAANEERGYWISGGIVIVGKGAVIPDHTII